MSKVFAYIDETGDRGNSNQSSPIFGMAAVLVDETGTQHVQAAVLHLREKFRVPDDKVMSWKEHVSTHERRKYAAQVLASVSGTKITYVYCQKSAVSGGYLADRTVFYNYVALKLYKNILWAARNWKGPNAQLWTRFGHVRNHDHTKTSAYFEAQKRWSNNIPFQMEQGLRWVSADKYLESQAADLYAGFLKAATWPDAFGNFEGAYLRTVWPLIRNSEQCAIPLGVMSMPSNDLVTGFEWFPCSHCSKKKSAS